MPPHLQAWPLKVGTIVINVIAAPPGWLTD